MSALASLETLVALATRTHMKPKPYEKLIVWQLAHKFAMEVYKHTKDFPKEERYGITSQLRRAALSVPTNIVEGQSRRTEKDFRNFLYTSKASLAECEYLLFFSIECDYFSEATFVSLENLRGRVSFLLNRLIDSNNQQIEFG